MEASTNKVYGENTLTARGIHGNYLEFKIPETQQMIPNGFMFMMMLCHVYLYDNT